jgi:hypothetical protein
MHERYKWQKHRDVKSVRVKTLCGFESRHRQALSSSIWQLHALRVSHSVLRVVTPFQLLEAHIIFFAVINRFTSSNRQPGPAVKMPVFTSSCIWRNGETFATSPSSFRQNPSKECPLLLPRPANSLLLLVPGHVERQSQTCRRLRCEKLDAIN